MPDYQRVIKVFRKLKKIIVIMFAYSTYLPYLCNVFKRYTQQRLLSSPVNYPIYNAK